MIMVRVKTILCEYKKKNKKGPNYLQFHGRKKEVTINQIIKLTRTYKIQNKRGFFNLFFEYMSIIHLDKTIVSKIAKIKYPTISIKRLTVPEVDEMIIK